MHLALALRVNGQHFMVDFGALVSVHEHHQGPMEAVADRHQGNGTHPHDNGEHEHGVRERHNREERVGAWFEQREPRIRHVQVGEWPEDEDEMNEDDHREDVRGRSRPRGWRGPAPTTSSTRPR